jgi:hypothetical protein
MVRFPSTPSTRLTVALSVGMLGVTLLFLGVALGLVTEPAVDGAGAPSPATTTDSGPAATDSGPAATTSASSSAPPTLGPLLAADRFCRESVAPIYTRALAADTRRKAATLRRAGREMSDEVRVLRASGPVDDSHWDDALAAGSAAASAWRSARGTMTASEYAAVHQRGLEETLEMIAALRGLGVGSCLDLLSGVEPSRAS